MQAFPLFISTKGRSVLVFGGGAEAAAKLRLIAKTEAKIWLIAPEIETAEIDLASLPNVSHVAQAALTAPLPSDAVFAYAATGERNLDAEIAGRMRGLGILVCAADQPQVSDFITPALIDRDPVVIAIGTEGAAPMLARRLKAQIEALVPSGLGHIARLARGLRPWVAKTLPVGRARRQFWQAFFDAPAPQNKAAAQDLAQRLVQPTNAATLNGRLTLIGTGTSDPELLTLKARRALDEADTILFEPGLTTGLLELARREAERLPLSALPSDPQAALKELKSRLEQGQAVAIVARGSQAEALFAPCLLDGLHDVALQILPGIDCPPPSSLQLAPQTAAA